MTSRRRVSTVVVAGVVGLLTAVALSRGELVSVQIWVSAATVWIVGALVIHLLALAGLEPASLVVAWRHSRRRRSASRGPSGLISLHSLLADGMRNPRTNAHRLRPRLEELAAHYIPVRHGIDIGRDPGRMSDLLGDVAWLLDPTVIDRAPTPNEIRKFLDIIMGDQDASEATQRSGVVATT